MEKLPVDARLYLLEQFQERQLTLNSRMLWGLYGSILTGMGVITSVATSIVVAVI